MKNKVVLVTGSAKGIGAAIIEEFAKNGYDVVINYLNSEEKALELLNKIKEYNVKCLALKCDVSQEDEVIKMLDTIKEKLGSVDILINNAAVDLNDFFYKQTTADFKRTFEVNVLGSYLVAKHVSKDMLNNKWGRIINISSTNGINTYYPITLPYDASKASIISLTHNLAVQLAPYVNVNAIAPGFIGTESELDGMDDNFIKEEEKKILVGRMGKPSEVAKLAYFLASEDASYINNSIIRIDGGQYGSN